MILRRSHLFKIIVQYLRRNSAYQCKAFVWVRQKGSRMYRCFHRELSNGPRKKRTGYVVLDNVDIILQQFK